MIFSFLVFDRHASCLYHRTWKGREDEDRKLAYGFVFSLRLLVRKLAPGDAPTHFRRLTAATYRLHLYETESGLRFILITDPSVADLQSEIEHIFKALWTEYVVKNPLWSPGHPVECDLFDDSLNRYVSSLKCYEG